MLVLPLVLPEKQVFRKNSGQSRGRIKGRPVLEAARRAEQLETKERILLAGIAQIGQLVMKLCQRKIQNPPRTGRSLCREMKTEKDHEGMKIMNANNRQFQEKTALRTEFQKKVTKKKQKEEMKIK